MRAIKEGLLDYCLRQRQDVRITKVTGQAATKNISTNMWRNHFRLKFSKTLQMHSFKCDK